MKPEIKKLWVAALRSGIYKQGTGCLRNSENQFCCLGVLDDVFEKQSGKTIWKQDEDGNWEFQGNKDVLSQEVQDWAGLDNSNPNVDGRWPDSDEERNESLAEYNDSDTPFENIADMIEAQL